MILIMIFATMMPTGLAAQTGQALIAWPMIEQPIFLLQGRDIYRRILNFILKALSLNITSSLIKKIIKIKE